MTVQRLQPSSIVACACSGRVRMYTDLSFSFVPAGDGTTWDGATGGRVIFMPPCWFHMDYHE
jgi:hypothetical protein